MVSIILLSLVLNYRNPVIILRITEKENSKREKKLKD